MLFVRLLRRAAGTTATGCGLGSAVTCVLGAFYGGPALADDWYAGAVKVVPKDEWIVAIDASATATSNQSQFAYAAGTIAVGGGTLQHSGLRLKLEGLGGTYGYEQAPTGVLARGKQFEGGALAGYQQVWQNATVALYLGLNVRENTIPAADPLNTGLGTRLGFKSAIDAYLRPTNQTMLSAYASYSTAYDAYYARARAGYAVYGLGYLGPELTFLGDDYYGQTRLGYVATCNPGGEIPKAWTPELNCWFVGRPVLIVEDNDDTGRAHTREVAQALAGVAASIKVLRFPDVPEHEDVTWWVEQGHHGKDELDARIAAAKPHQRQLRVAPIRDWDNMRAPEIGYGVDDRFPLKVVCLFSGEGGGGKSTTTQQFAVAHVLEREWLDCTPRKGPAIYVEREDPEDVLHWRQQAIAEHYGVTQAAIADAGFVMLPLADSEESAILATAPDKSGIIRSTPLYDQLYEMAGDLKPVMIGIASAAIVFAGNENVRPEVQHFMWLLRRLAHVSGGYVLLVAQPSLTGMGDASVSHAGLSGTTQWHNGSRGRAVLRAVKPEGNAADTGLREITFYKNQYGPLSASCFVRYSNGLFLPVEGMAMDAAERTAKVEEIFIRLLKKFAAQHQPVNHLIGRNYAPSRFAEQVEAAGIGNRELKAAMQRLLDAGRIEIRETPGKSSRRAFYLAMKGSP